MELHNKKLELYVQTVLNKNIIDFQKEDFDWFEVLSFEGEFQEEYPTIDYSDLTFFSNVKRLVISDAFVKNQDIAIFIEKNIREICFKHCMFEQDLELGKLVSLESLELICSSNFSYDFLDSLTSLKTLSIIKPYTEVPISLTFLSKVSTIQSLTLQGCSIDDFSYLSGYQSICYLNLITSDIPLDPVDTLNRMDGLRELYISERHNLKELHSNIIVKNNFNDFLADS